MANGQPFALGCEKGSDPQGPLWGRVFFFANCDARPWADPELLDLWSRHVTAGPPFLHASPNLFRDLGRA